MSDEKSKITISGIFGLGEALARLHALLKLLKNSRTYIFPRNFMKITLTLICILGIKSARISKK